MNIQNDCGKAKAYQVRQVLAAIDKKEAQLMTTMTSPEVTHYGYRVLWSAQDQEFVATCLEFPSLSWLAATQEEALKGIRDLVREVIDDLRADGQQAPQPLSSRAYSGKFNVRLGEQLHRRLAMEAAEQHLSLNQYVVRRLNNAP